MKRGNPNHWPAGTPIGGQFAPKGVTGVVRGEPMKNDIDSYIDSEYFGSNVETEQKKRIENINNALYDGGYILEQGDTLCGFNSAYEAEQFIFDIATRYKESRWWKKHKNLVENYVRVVRGYLERDNFDIVGNGKYSNTGKERKVDQLMEELGWELGEDRYAMVKATLLSCLTADTFVESGKNTSQKPWNEGTVVMTFSPRMETKQEYVDTKTGKRVVEKKTIDLYVKMVINPHPQDTKTRKQPEMQIISFKEAGEPNSKSDKFDRQAKTCLYTGERRQSRLEWALNKYRGHKDHPDRRRE